jgi:hypothetical protein
MARKLSQKTVEPNNDQYSGGYPLNKPVAAYYRVSTLAQTTNISMTRIQKEDIPTMLLAMGWREDQIIKIDEDSGISGTTGEDDRPGLKRLSRLIEDGVIGAVAVVNPDRLFRDSYLIHAGKFVEACVAQGVMIFVPGYMDYDFRNPQLAGFFVDRFLDDCRNAGKYLEYQIKGRLNKARSVMQRLGQWAGGVIAPGYMVNKVTSKYEPFPPAADVVLAYFELFVHRFRGNAHRCAVHIANYGPYFPDWESPEVQALVPEGYFVQKPISMKRKANGQFYPAYSTLSNLLTSPTYLGHWIFRDQILMTADNHPVDNHPPLVSMELFTAAFNYLSPTLFDGTRNPDYRPNRSSRNSVAKKFKGERTEKPLLQGKLYAPDERGEMKLCNTLWVHGKRVKNPGWYYRSMSYVHSHPKCLWTKQAQIIDGFIEWLLTESLTDENNSATFNSVVSQSSESDTKAIKRELASDRKDLERQRKRRDNLVKIIPDEDDDGVRKLYRDELRAVNTRVQALEAKIEAQENALKRHDEMVIFKHQAYGFLLQFKTLPRHKKETAIQVFINRVEAVPKHDTDLVIAVYCNDGSTHTTTIPLFKESGWLKTESDTLIELVESGADQVTIAETFPQRSWKLIKMKYHSMTGNKITLKDKPIHNRDKFEEFLERTAVWSEVEHHDIDFDQMQHTDLDNQPSGRSARR